MIGHIVQFRNLSRFVGKCNIFKISPEPLPILMETDFLSLAHLRPVLMASSSLSKRQRLIAISAAAALVLLSWLYFSELWTGVIVTGARDSNAVS